MVVCQGDVRLHVREVLLVSLIQNGIFKCVVCNWRRADGFDEGGPPPTLARPQLAGTHDVPRITIFPRKLAGLPIDPSGYRASGERWIDRLPHLPIKH